MSTEGGQEHRAGPAQKLSNGRQSHTGTSNAHQDLHPASKGSSGADSRGDVQSLNESEGSSKPSAGPKPAVTHTYLTLGEAAGLYNISRSTLHRRLKAKKIPGAQQIPGSRNGEWRIPSETLNEMGLTRRQQQPDPPNGSGGVNDLRPAIGVPSADVIDISKKERIIRLDVEEPKPIAEAETARLGAARATAQRDEERRRAEKKVAAQLKTAKATAKREKRRRRSSKRLSSAVRPGQTFRTRGPRVGRLLFAGIAILSALALIAFLSFGSLIFGDRLDGRSSEEQGLSAGAKSSGAASSETSSRQDPDTGSGNPHTDSPLIDPANELEDWNASWDRVGTSWDGFGPRKFWRSGDGGVDSRSK